MKRMMRGLAVAAALVLSATGGGCAGVGLEDVLNGGLGEMSGTELRGEVVGVNTRSRYIELETERGRHESVRYDSRTQVIHGNRRTSPGALERGDEVTVRLNRDSRGERFAESVYVRGRSSVGGWQGDRDQRDRDRARHEVRSLEGRVGRVERRQGRFQMRTEGHGVVWVSMTRNARSSERRQLERLHDGDYVRIRGRFVSNNHFEARSFR